MTRPATAALAATAACLLAGCQTTSNDGDTAPAARDASIVGDWSAVSRHGEDLPQGMAMVLSLQDDGNASVRVYVTEDDGSTRVADEDSFSYTLDGDVLICTPPGEDEPYSFFATVTPEMLDLFPNEGDGPGAMVFTRMN